MAFQIDYIDGTHDIISVGDHVLLNPAEPNELPYVARILGFQNIGHDHFIHLTYYYRPEETVQGRWAGVHGAAELFWTTHADVQHTDTIRSKCTVYTLDEYYTLWTANELQFFSRFEYNIMDGEVVYADALTHCYCETYECPERLMVQCDGCDEWFHVECLFMDQETGWNNYDWADFLEEVVEMEGFTCGDLHKEIW